MKTILVFPPKSISAPYIWGSFYLIYPKQAHTVKKPGKNFNLDNSGAE
jgi:hypothetical protein